ncbi:MAG: hypothetical protein AB7O13_03330 [Alphaproteobacteria bacterium]
MNSWTVLSARYKAADLRSPSVIVLTTCEADVEDFCRFAGGVVVGGVGEHLLAGPKGGADTLILTPEMQDVDEATHVFSQLPWETMWITELAEPSMRDGILVNADLPNK